MYKFLMVFVSVGMFMPLIVSAHSVVRPAEVGVAKYQTFTLGVPTEKEQATIGVRLVIPEDMTSASPNVKPGWQIELKRENDQTKEIIWTGGSIPAHFRDEFLFSAKAPAEAGSVSWKVYQTYADGSVVAWDQDPKVEQPKTADGKSDFSKAGPYSETKIVNDLGSAPDLSDHNASATNQTQLALGLGGLGVIVGLAAFFRRR